MGPEKLKGSHAMDRVRPIEELHGGTFRNPHFVVEASHFSVFEGNPFVHSHLIVVTSLDHKGPGRDHARPGRPGLPAGWKKELDDGVAVLGWYNV